MLFKLIKELTKCLDTSGVVETVLMRQSKACDCLPHDFRIAKLATYGCGNTTLKLIHYYLINRLLWVRIEWIFSSYFQILRVVPQRQLVEPILFNLFKNDLMLFIKESEVCSFANDTAIYSWSSNYEEVNQNSSNNAHIVLKWFQINK